MQRGRAFWLNTQQELQTLLYHQKKNLLQLREEHKYLDLKKMHSNLR